MAATEDLELTMAVGEWVKTTAHKAMADGMDEERAVQFAVTVLADMLDKAFCVIAALALKEGPEFTSADSALFIQPTERNHNQ